MKKRSTITAAFALAAATILTVAACGSSVSGSAQPNPAAQTAELPSVDLTLPSDLPSELSELNSALSDLPTT